MDVADEFSVRAHFLTQLSILTFLLSISVN